MASRNLNLNYESTTPSGRGSTNWFTNSSKGNSSINSNSKGPSMSQNSISTASTHFCLVLMLLMSLLLNQEIPTTFLRMVNPRRRSNKWVFLNFLFTLMVLVKQKPSMFTKISWSVRKIVIFLSRIYSAPQILSTHMVSQSLSNQRNTLQNTFSTSTSSMTDLSLDGIMMSSCVVMLQPLVLQYLVHLYGHTIHSTSVYQRPVLTTTTYA